MSRQSELVAAVLPQVTAAGGLGDNVTFVDCVCDEKTFGESHFASSVSFVTATFKSADQGTFQQALVVKYNINHEEIRNVLKLDEQFQNELLLYREVLPFLDSEGVIQDIFPKFFHGSAQIGEDPNAYFIVLEDLRSKNFRLTTETLDLDFKHSALAFKKLGAFHGLSFLAKQTKPRLFYNIVNKLIETRLFEEKEEEWSYLLEYSVGMAAEQLLKKGNYVVNIESFRKKLKNPYGYFKELMTAREPMAVICHGDFCRNNVFYKCSENGVPIDVKFFDVATARYTTPMVDFTLFFFLNSSEESRRLYREEYLSIYYQSLCASCEGVSVPTLEDFKEEFRQKAVYGFLICSFFKLEMLNPGTLSVDPFVEVKMSPKERAALVLSAREQDRLVIANMLRELIDLGCEF